MDIKYTNIFHAKALKNIPKLGIFGMETHHLATPIPFSFEARDSKNVSKR
jgi:hypothetical protein